MRDTNWAKRFGLNVLGEVDNTQDNPGGYRTAADAVAARYPNADVVLTCNDAYALTVAQVLSSSGRASILVTGNDGGARQGFGAVEAGKLFSVYSIPWDEVGVQAAYAAYAATAGTSIPKVVIPKGQLITSANAKTAKAAGEEQHGDPRHGRREQPGCTAPRGAGPHRAARQHPPLDSAQLTVSRPGAVHALLGQSGCGKSTMLGVLAGQLRPAGGRITLAGRDHAFTSTVDSRAAGVSMVSQELSLAPHLSVAENVLMGRALPLDDDAGESPRPRRRRRRGREWAGAWEGRRSRLRG